MTAAYGTAVGGQLVVTALSGFGPGDRARAGQPAELDDALHVEVLFSTAGCMMAGIAALIVRRRKRRRPRRRAVAWLVDTFALNLPMIAALLVMGAFGVSWFLGAQRLTLLVLGLAPVAFLGHAPSNGPR